MLDALKLFFVGLFAPALGVGWTIRYTNSKEAILVEKEIKDEKGESTDPPTIKKWTEPDHITGREQFPVIEFKCPFCGHESNWVSEHAAGFCGGAPVVPFCCNERKKRPIPYPIGDEKFRVHLLSQATLNFNEPDAKFLDTWGGGIGATDETEFQYQKSEVPWT